MLLSVAMAVLGLAWGCGEMPSQATPDEAAKAQDSKGPGSQHQVYGEKRGNAAGEQGQKEMTEVDRGGARASPMIDSQFRSLSTSFRS